MTPSAPRKHPRFLQNLLQSLLAPIFLRAPAQSHRAGLPKSGPLKIGRDHVRAQVTTGNLVCCLWLLKTRRPPSHPPSSPPVPHTHLVLSLVYPPPMALFGRRPPTRPQRIACSL